MDIRRTPGTQLANDRTGEVIYTPPEGEARLRDMLANWERFLHNQTELDPLIRMAVGHYQFEAIHPFTDGNGRTGRVLNILYLIQEELLNLPILYLSRHVIAHKADYYRLLLSVTRDRPGSPGCSSCCRPWPKPPNGPPARSPPSARWPSTPPNTCARACPRSTPASWWT
jgi:Fic family protein